MDSLSLTFRIKNFVLHIRLTRLTLHNDYIIVMVIRKMKLIIRSKLVPGWRARYFFHYGLSRVFSLRAIASARVTRSFSRQTKISARNFCAHNTV
jgi:hypothetical protein